MSFADNRSFELWSGFMPKRKKLANVRRNDLFSLQTYPKGFDFSDATREFTKWAGAAVNPEAEIPEDFKSIEIPEGKYAVFLHVGSGQTAAITFGHIFNHWLPNSGFELDDRPHFEILGAKYKNNDPDSEEEIFIPIR
ncbi:GyrI-like domain-containing protein [Flavobacterium sp.]|uniref:GyrI-like domain-containing protein n=1 Tax=Flavobacterium sp. TaxID=239 RepID=UPI0025C0A5D7|nr:GyrI-like domain-containing protein [Flavobacterium sp.]